MTDYPYSTEQKASNAPEYTVTSLSMALKNVVEDRFGYVRLRGEISGLKRAASGHVYLALKDEKSVLDGIMWKGVAGHLTFRPEDGLEVICTGKLTTYPGRSKYQIVIDRMEPAGVGALMALLEERKNKLAAEGLFDPSRKKKIPYLPEVIGVVTSPTGAVIRDILHRLADRFARPVIVWPVLVQGDGAAAQIAEAIRGFNKIPYTSGGTSSEQRGIRRPDVLIVARGGGSLEDLWAFNEEIVLRAVAQSDIPIISAVGHETDTTLIDYVSDLRAPTPTAAAEHAVPVRDDLIYTVLDLDHRLKRSVRQMVENKRQILTGLSRGLPKPSDMLALSQQRLDDIWERLPRAFRHTIENKSQILIGLNRGLPKPSDMLMRSQQRLDDVSERLPRALILSGERRQMRLDTIGRLLRPDMIVRDIRQSEAKVIQFSDRITRAEDQIFHLMKHKYAATARLFESLNYKAVLERGFAVIRDEEGSTVTLASQVIMGHALDIEFKDGRVGATATEASDSSTSPEKSPKKSKAKKPATNPKKSPKAKDDRQGTLL